MPKASKFEVDDSVPLKRNQACHLCRKRKRRCDAGRPCGACTKHFAKSIAVQALRGETFDVPCTYDEPADSPTSTSTPSQDTIGPSDSKGDFYQNVTSDISSLTINSTGLSNGPYQLSPFQNFSPQSDNPFPVSNNSTPAPEPFIASDLLPSSYGSNLPPPDMLHHLAGMLFTCVPLASRLFHRPTFLASLNELPSSPAYPSTALLHAICALASLYSPVVHQRPKPDLRVRPPVQLFLDGEDVVIEQGLNRGQAGTFAVEQSGLARIAVELDVRTGSKLMDAARTYVVLTWYYYANAQWADWWTTASTATRVAGPFGLNISGSVDIFNHLEFEPVLPLPENPLEQEKRRNLFWLLFMNDRHQHMGTRWPISLDEADIQQELPGTLTDFESNNITQGPRQRLHDPDLLTSHPPHMTDPFTLHLKGIALVSRIGTFNTRARMRLHSDRNNNSTANRFDGSWPNLSDPTCQPINEMPEFRHLDEQITAFRQSIPKEFRDPFARAKNSSVFSNAHSGSSVDPNLYEVFVLPHVATIMLYDPYVDMYAASDRSRDKIFNAARSIVNSVHALNATSYDVSLMVHYCHSHWVGAARILGRFYMRAVELGMDEEAELVRQDVDTLCSAIGRMGEKLHVAYRAQKALVDMMDAAKAYGDIFRQGQEDVSSTSDLRRTAQSVFGGYGFF